MTETLSSIGVTLLPFKLFLEHLNIKVLSPMKNYIINNKTILKKLCE